MIRMDSGRAASSCGIFASEKAWPRLIMSCPLQSFGRTVVWCRLPSKTGGYPAHLISYLEGGRGGGQSSCVPKKIHRTDREAQTRHAGNGLPAEVTRSTVG
jgi:hypothetical protein